MQSSNALDVDASAEDLLAEIAGQSPSAEQSEGSGSENQLDPDPPAPHTPELSIMGATPLHSNPLTHTPLDYASTPLPKGGSIEDVEDKNVTVAGGTVTNAEESTTCVSSSGIPTPSENDGDSGDSENIGYTPL